MKMELGLFGLDFFSGNMGCQALAYSFVHMLEEITEEKVILHIFQEGIDEGRELALQGFDLNTTYFRIKDKASLKELKSQINKCDYVIDFTQGDSFSDIYGLKRMIRVSYTKLMTIKNKKKLILGPQTYGPYKNFISKKLANIVFKKSYAICSRDEISKQVVYDISGREIEAFTDVAFMLPYEKTQTNNKRLGINVSGLLWSGGYSSDNQFGVKVDYKEYITKLIEYGFKNGYEVHLIPHVITKNPDNIENDITAIHKVKELYPNCIIAPTFSTPMEAKSYICTMEVFIGARMHATIGGVSSGTPTIPFSYSKKFEGLFRKLNYPYTIEALNINTEEALEKTYTYLNNIEVIKRDLESSRLIIEQNIENLKNWFIKQMGV